MTPSDMADVLSAAGIYDGRKISAADAAAWHAAVGQFSREDALAAVVRHYADSTEWMKPAHLKAQILIIHNERAQKREHEIRALPSRFEVDQLRDRRIAAGVLELMSRWSVPAETDESPRGRALARARRERGNRLSPAGQSIRKRVSGDVKTQPAPWSDPAIAEKIAIQALHDAGRDCGRPACPQCRGGHA